MTTTQRGFTLIELLVVIAIIGLLSTVILATLGSARSKARDARRLSDMDSIHTALELYLSNNGSYPNSIPGGFGTWGMWECGNNNANDTFMPYLATDKDISKAPQEGFWPGNNGNNWTECSYRYAAPVPQGTPCGSPSGNYAVLYMRLENPAPSRYSLPACASTWGWGEGSAGDPNGAILILPM